ncbi:LOW QUALITY PROTEIN: hypothetical protein NC651_012033 [Populus alba x Populus x berolinensis]|nr:LOW QUALITY PROTEIN: hypothetical protein NC651_012033 [Populus alba x Populus x berolinensis]
MGKLSNLEFYTSKYIFAEDILNFVPAHVSNSLGLEALCSAYHIPVCREEAYRLRDAMVCLTDPPRNTMMHQPSIPKRMLLDGEHNLETHFSLNNYQIKQVRTSAGHCFVVMPPLWCRLDRLWFAHPGVLVGSMTRQPFLCPLDHVFEVNSMLKEQPEEEFGPAINFREYSFLDNPLLPRHVKESRLDVQLCQEGAEGCGGSNKTSQPGILRFPKRSNEDMFKTTFSSFKDVKVIQFSSMQEAFVGIWCCVENHDPGHIYYDMYWDEKSDWKPMPPQSAEDDHPPWKVTLEESEYPIAATVPFQSTKRSCVLVRRLGM